MREVGKRAGRNWNRPQPGIRAGFVGVGGQFRHPRKGDVKQPPGEVYDQYARQDLNLQPLAPEVKEGVEIKDCLYNAIAGKWRRERHLRQNSHGVWAWLAGGLRGQS